MDLTPPLCFSSLLRCLVRVQPFIIEKIVVGVTQTLMENLL